MNGRGKTGIEKADCELARVDIYKGVYIFRVSALRGAVWFLLIFLAGMAGCCSESDIPIAKKKLYSDSAKERNQGALDLASCGTRAGSAVPRLITLLYDENVGVQSSAAYALRKIDTPEAREALERATAARKKR
jgi:hypothetical protein